jgi:DNA-binding GntR family transcriptional regulator
MGKERTVLKERPVPVVAKAATEPAWLQLSFDASASRSPISPQIYERLRRAITTLELAPSEAMSEKELAVKLGVSRTPVREALRRLADEGLIDVLPQRGSFVAPIRLKDVEEAQFIRETLEVAVVRRLAGHATEASLNAARENLREQEQAVRDEDRALFLELDEAFHRTLCEAAGLAKSWRVIQAVKMQMDRVRFLSLPEAGQLRTLMKQHRAILAGIAEGEPDGAADQMAAHLQLVLRTVRKLEAERPELFSS